MSLYADLGGFDVILAVCRRWHRLCLEDPLSAHPFEHGLHPQHDERLAAYLAEATGGPALYTGGYGDETVVQRMHADKGAGEELEDACLTRFDRALAEERVPVEAAAALNAYFRAATVALRVYAERPASDVPDGLPFNYA